MDFIEELEDQLTLETLEEEWKNHLDGIIEDEDERRELLEWVTKLRDEFLDFADVVQDPEEVKDALVHRYIELKCHWQMLNTKMQYQAVNQGQPDQSLMVRGSLISSLLEKKENLLGGDEVANLTDFLADPLDALEADRVEEDKLREFMDFVGELIVTGEMYNHLQDSLSDEDVSDEFTRNLQSTNQAFQELSSDLQESLLEIREVPIENHLQKYPVLIRKMIEEEDREIEVDLTGEKTPVDSELIETIEPSLTSMVRFFGKYSIESPDERENSGKDPVGTISITVDRVGDDIVFELESDGKGIDEDFLDENADCLEETKWVSEESLTDDQILSVMYYLGRKASDESENSKQPAFLDQIEELRGTVDLVNNSTDGIHIKITVPRTQSVIVVEGLQVQAEGEEFIIPLSSVIESVPLDESLVTSVEGTGQAIQLREKIYPLHDLSEALNLTDNNQEPQQSVAMILSDSGSEYALKVDEIRGQQKVVVRELGPVFEGMDYTSGSAMMGDGEISLVLDVNGLRNQFEG